MHRLLFALVAVGFTVSVITATPATPVDPMPAIVRDSTRMPGSRIRSAPQTAATWKLRDAGPTIPA